MFGWHAIIRALQAGEVQTLQGVFILRILRDKLKMGLTGRSEA